MNFTKIEADLFAQDHKYALAHCIAEDARMGAGIATQFVKRYPTMRTDLHSQQPKTGQVIPFTETGKPLVINMITKKRSSGKPTRQDFNTTVNALKVYMLQQGLTHLAIPLIGAGLDQLDWSESEEYIREVFKDTDIEIILCLTADSKRIHDSSWERFYRVRGI